MVLTQQMDPFDLENDKFDEEESCSKKSVHDFQKKRKNQKLRAKNI